MDYDCNSMGYGTLSWELKSTGEKGDVSMKKTLKRGKINCKGFCERFLSSEKIRHLLNEVSECFGFNEPETIKMENSYYSIVREFDLCGETYYMLINESDPSDMLFRKQLIEDGGCEYLIGLEDKAEVDRLLSHNIDEICEVWWTYWDEAPDLRLAFELGRR